MSEEDLNQEISTDELKDVSGGFEAKVGGQVQAKGNPQWGEICDVGTSVKGDVANGYELGKKGKKNTSYDCQDLSG